MWAGVGRAMCWWSSTNVRDDEADTLAYFSQSSFDIVCPYPFRIYTFSNDPPLPPTYLG